MQHLRKIIKSMRSGFFTQEKHLDISAFPIGRGLPRMAAVAKIPRQQRDKSDAAVEFEQLLKTEFQIGKTKGAILVGTGDNFAPEIEARDFCDPPAGQPGDGKNYQRVGKELFDWDAISKQWIRSDSHSQGNATPANGHFMIPTDNVANFFVKEGYAALVPGKQDFYFGPERIRELARFMATQPIPSTSGTLHSNDGGVQMLGANIVIETTWNTATSAFARQRKSAVVHSPISGRLRSDR